LNALSAATCGAAPSFAISAQPFGKTWPAIRKDMASHSRRRDRAEPQGGRDLRDRKFADSSLEGTGFELLVRGRVKLVVGRRPAAKIFATVSSADASIEFFNSIQDYRVAVPASVELSLSSRSSLVSVGQ
jgi:hypothetical protein